MTIKFTTTDGRTVETTDKDVLIAAARNGDVNPETLVEVNGKTYLAKKIKELTFGAQSSQIVLSSRQKTLRHLIHTFLALPLLGCIIITIMGFRLQESTMASAGFMLIFATMIPCYIISRIIDVSVFKLK